ERAEDVVMPPRREGEAGEDRLDHLARAMRAEEPGHEQELPPAMLGVPHRGDPAPAMQLVMAQAFKSKERRVHRRVRRAPPLPTVPAPIRHLLLEQVVGNGVESVVVIIEGAEDGKHNAGDARFAYAPPAIVDAVVALQPLVEQKGAGLPRL